MLRKLALGGIKSRFRDYAVLFSGLVIASAVFYMFMAIATNQAFLNQNSAVGMTALIFGLGEVLLVIITTVYIVYANSFLMSMRQRDYAMFMMLGAKSRKIAQLIFIETVTVGILAAAVGVLIGVGLTGVVGRLLRQQLHAPATHFAAVWPPALALTLAFFVVMFVLAAFVNARHLLKTPVLTLLHAAQTPNRLQTRPWRLTVQALLALVLLAIGYWALGQLASLQLAALGLALVTIVLGSYLLFNSLLVWLIALLKRNQRFAAKRLRTFTLSQLSFRIRDYTKILAVVSILFALALGAITTGLGFEHDIPLLASQQNAYDLVTVDATPAVQRQAQQLTGVTHQAMYHLKSDAHHVYFNAAELNKQPLELVTTYHIGDVKATKVRAKAFKRVADDDPQQLSQFLTKADLGKTLTVASATKFAQVAGPTRLARTYQVSDFRANYDRIDQITKTMAKVNGFQSVATTGQKITAYALVNGIFSGMAFMGFFLGIAFLAMLASTLMFKILSGANYDQSRYLMLQKIGVRPQLLRRSIRQEIGALFLFPGLLGMVHVLFGLQLFQGLLQQPYSHLEVPFGMFVVLYGAYYLVTVWLYERIVLKKEIASN